MAATEFYYGTGRRKTSTARVWLRPKAKDVGVITINNRTLDEYFGRPTGRMVVRQPLEVTELQNQFDVTINTAGGGISGQAGAIRLGIARALLQYEGELRKVLRQSGYLTRNSKKVERKKVGRHKARKGTQYSKR